MPDFGSPTQTFAAHIARNITTLATTVVKTGPGVVRGVLIGTPNATGTIKLYDNTAGSGTVIATLTMVAGGPTFAPLDVGFSVGLTVVTAVAAGDITVIYS